MTARVAWYAHHHGSGHLARAAAVAPHLRSQLTVLSSATTSGLDVTVLPSDVRDDPPPPPPGLHYAPFGIGERMAALAAAFAEADLVVVDVSVEVALLARLCGAPVAIVRQHGDRSDLPHRLAYAWAAELLAPFPEWMEDAPDLRDRTFYAGGFTRRPAASAEAVPGRVVVLGGSGGGEFGDEDVRAAERACPGTEWILLGAGHWHEEPEELIASAEVVVAHGGHNAVMEVAAAGRPLVCVPQERPFGEQRAKAEVLRRAGAAVVAERWPAPADWPAWLDEARRLDPDRLARAVDGEGARRFARRIDELAQDLEAVALPEDVALVGHLA